MTNTIYITVVLHTRTTQHTTQRKVFFINKAYDIVRFDSRGKQLIKYINFPKEYVLHEEEEKYAEEQEEVSNKDENEVNHLVNNSHPMLHLNDDYYILMMTRCHTS